MFHIESLRPEDWQAALELALARDSDEERDGHVEHCLELLASGRLDPAHVWVARDDDGVVIGTQVCAPLAGATSLFWLPTAPDSIADALVRAGLKGCQAHGIKIAQAFFTADEMPFAQPLLRQGFRHVTRMHQMEHLLADLPLLPSSELRYETYRASRHQDFMAVLRRTYEGTLDIPELNGTRSIDEIIAGHQAEGNFDPAYWWLAYLGDQPAGVVLSMELGDGLTWDLSYLGIVPVFRGQGHGRASLLHAMHVIRETTATRLIIAVDDRNVPALELYRSVGFVECESYEVILHLASEK